MISATVITHDEAKNIGVCLRSLRWVDEIVVVDSGSTDGTVALAEEFGARVFERKWTGYSDQRNFAIDQCTGDWILYLDADERLSEGFETEARRIERLGDAAADGYWVNSLEFFLGDFLRHGGFGLHQPNRKIRLWRSTPGARFHGNVHERVRVDGRLDSLDSYVEHYSTASTLDGLFEKLVVYSKLESDRRGGQLDLLLGPLRVFLSRYLKHQGYRDGARGAVMAGAQAFYMFMILARSVERRYAEQQAAQAMSDTQTEALDSSRLGFPFLRKKTSARGRGL